MTDSQSLVESAVREAFPEADHAAIMSLLNAYGTEAHERERERVQLAIVKLSKADPGKLQYYVDVAKVDYRDVLAWVSRPVPTVEESARDLAAAKEVLRRWGRK